MCDCYFKPPLEVDTVPDSVISSDSFAKEPVLPENSYHTLSSRQPYVVMMQATDFWKLYYLSSSWWLHRSRLRTIHCQRQMRAPAKIIIKIAGKYSFQMTIVQHDDMIQTIPPDAANHAFCQGLRGAESTSSMPMLWTRF